MPTKWRPYRAIYFTLCIHGIRERKSEEKNATSVQQRNADTCTGFESYIVCTRHYLQTTSQKNKMQVFTNKKVLRVLQNLRRTADSEVAETSNSTPVRSAFP